MDITILLITLVCLLDIAVLYEIVRSERSRNYRILYALIVFLLPVIGVTLYYIVRK